MPRLVRRVRVPMAVLGAAGLMLATAAPAVADGGGNPVGNLVKQVQGQVGDPLKTLTTGATSATGTTGATPAPDPGAPNPPASDSDSGANETANPKAPDHAGSDLVHTTAGGQQVAQIGHDRSTVKNDNQTKSDATLLAVGGQEVIGAHASSTGKKSDRFATAQATQPICDSSGGQVCLEVLYADAFATDNGSTSHSQSQSGIAKACIGGTKKSPTAKCDGPVSVGVGSGSAVANRNAGTGRTRAHSRSDLADVCLSQPAGSPPLPLPSGPATGCAVSAGAVHSQGSADSGGSKPSASRGSYLLDLSGGGMGDKVDQPQSLEVPPGSCTKGPAVVCGYLNQGETYLGKHAAGHAQDALKTTLLKGTGADVFVRAGHTETLVHNNGGQPSARPPAKVRGQHGGAGPGRPGSGVLGTRALSGVLPNTGGVWTGLLAGGLLTLGAGLLLVADARRKLLASA